MREEMSPEDFQSWKEANKWFFDYLEKQLSEIDEMVTENAKTVLVCSPAQLDNSRMATAALVGQASALQNIVDLEYEDIEGNS